MVGWGLKNDDIEPDELQEAQVIVTDRAMCKGSSRYTDMCVQSRSSNSPLGLINQTKNKQNKSDCFFFYSSSCTGDSGSGLFYQKILTNEWCVVGVASSSNTDICEETQFSTYAQASSQDYVDWFKDVLNKKNTFDDLQRLERCKPKTVEQKFCKYYAC